MLSFLRVIQPLHSQPHAGHPGSHNSCDRPLLLSGDHRPAIWSGSQPGYSDPHRNGHFHTDLYQYIYDHPDSDSDSDSNLHPDNHRYAHRFADSQCLAYLHLDVDSHVHLHVKPNADSYIHTDIDVNIYFHADFHFY